MGWEVCATGITHELKKMLLLDFLKLDDKLSIVVSWPVTVDQLMFAAINVRGFL